MRPKTSRPLRSAFTFVEILVVLAIIAVVIALLLPFIKRAWRTAQVLASPIAYVGTDNRLHLTDERGRTDITLAPVARPACPFCHSPPTWSPSGQSIAMQYQAAGHSYTLIINPMSGQSTRLPSFYGFLAWADSDHIVTASSRSTIAVRRTDNNNPHRIYNPPFKPLNLAATPLTAPFPYVGTIELNDRPAIVFFRRDMTVARTIYHYPRGTDTLGMKEERVGVDPTGEYVAWTHPVAGGNVARRTIAVKSLREPEWKSFSVVTASTFRSAYFCDWTENGNILINATQDHESWRLWVLSKRGGRVSHVASDIPPIGGSVASWRKYGHR